MRCRLVVVGVVAAAALMGCNGGEPGTDDVTDAEPEPVDGEPDADDGETGEEDTVGEPAEPRVWEIGEAIQQDGLEIVLERVVAEEFHTEVELRAVNTTADETVGIARDLSVRGGRPQLFDERDRRFVYQHPAGLDAGEWIEVGPGQRLEATLVFRGAVQPDAELLTLRLEPRGDRGELTWQVPVQGQADR